MGERKIVNALIRTTAVLSIALATAIVVTIILGHHATALQAQQPDSRSTQEKSGTDHSQMPGMDMDEAKKTEERAVHDMSMGHHHDPGPHMRMTSLRPQTPQDLQRAGQIVETLRPAIKKYKDYRVALTDGYKIFLPNLPQPEYHFSNYWNGFLEAFTWDPARPTSLLYKKTADGYQLVGAMYTMPKRATDSELDARVPLSVARWHLHTNLCLPQKDQAAQAEPGPVGVSGLVFLRQAKISVQVPSRHAQRDPRVEFTVGGALGHCVHRSDELVAVGCLLVEQGSGPRGVPRERLEKTVPVIREVIFGLREVGAKDLVAVRQSDAVVLVLFDCRAEGFDYLPGALQVLRCLRPQRSHAHVRAGVVVMTHGHVVDGALFGFLGLIHIHSRHLGMVRPGFPLGGARIWLLSLKRRGVVSQDDGHNDRHSQRYRENCSCSYQCIQDFPLAHLRLPLLHFTIWRGKSQVGPENDNLGRRDPSS